MAQLESPSVAGAAKATRAAAPMFLLLFACSIVVWLVPSAKAQTTQALTNLQEARLSWMTILDDVGCKPVQQIVEIPRADNDRGVYPSSVMLDRCNNCCSGNLVVCGPKRDSNEIWRIPILRIYKFNDTNGLQTKHESVNLEVHRDCEWQCRIKATDCDPRVHNYDAQACRCECKNATSSGMCRLNRDWSYHSCSCECSLRAESCPTGSLFDFANCQCLIIHGGSRMVVTRPMTGTITHPSTPGDQ